MKISTRVEYGLAALIDIAIYSSTQNLVNVASIAKRQNIPSKYLEQVLTPLRQARLIIGIKGAKGGYVLGKTASLITMTDILNVLDSSIIGEYYESGLNCAYTMKKIINDNLWKHLEKNINQIASSVTLEMLVDKYKETISEENIMFYI